jgi:hypothetical protein
MPIRLDAVGFSSIGTSRSVAARTTPPVTPPTPPRGPEYSTLFCAGLTYALPPKSPVIIAESSSPMRCHIIPHMTS